MEDAERVRAEASRLREHLHEVFGEAFGIGEEATERIRDIANDPTRREEIAAIAPDWSRTIEGKTGPELEWGLRVGAISVAVVETIVAAVLPELRLVGTPKDT